MNVIIYFYTKQETYWTWKEGINQEAEPEAATIKNNVGKKKYCCLLQLVRLARMVVG